VTRFDRDPQRFALEALAARFNRVGRFAHFLTENDPVGRRVHLESTRELTCVGNLRDLDGDLTTLYEHPSGAMVALREWRCATETGCDDLHGTLEVNAPDHGALLDTVAAALGGAR
jgi:hypothetical protein